MACHFTGVTIIKPPIFKARKATTNICKVSQLDKGEGLTNVFLIFKIHQIGHAYQLI